MAIDRLQPYLRQYIIKITVNIFGICNSLFRNNSRGGVLLPGMKTFCVGGWFTSYSRDYPINPLSFYGLSPCQNSGERVKIDTSLQKLDHFEALHDLAHITTPRSSQRPRNFGLTMTSQDIGLEGKRRVVLRLARTRSFLFTVCMKNIFRQELFSQPNNQYVLKNHSWTSPSQKRAGFDEHQGLRQKNCTNAKDTARLHGQNLSSCCCFDLFVYNSKCKH